jgi:hypothetical protein
MTRNTQPVKVVEMENENERFSRRGLIRKIAELGAVAGIAGLLLDRFRDTPSLPRVEACGTAAC